MSKRQRAVKSSEEKLYYEIRAMPAAITKKQVFEMEASYQEDSHGVARRTALGVLANPCAHIFDQIASDREAAVAMAEAQVAIDAYIVHLKAITETMTAASTRLMVGLCARAD